MARRAAALSLLLVVGVAALVLAVDGGGNDRKEADQTVRDFVKAVNARDADRYCDDLITKGFLEKSTFATGDRASESCKREIRAMKDVRVELVRIAGTKVDGDTAIVTAVLKRPGQRLKQRLRLEKDGGDWKIAGTG